MPQIYIPCLDLRSGRLTCDVDPILPPLPRTQRGRPKKKRTRGPDENEPNESVKVTRKGYDVKCEIAVKRATMLGVATNH
jgi:hypothetical protein